MSVALVAVEAPPRRGRRTETEIAAQAAMALLAAGLLSTGADKPAGRKPSRSAPAVSDAALARVADVVGVPVAALRDAWDTNQSSGYRPPRPERGRAAAPSLQGQRPGNRERFAAKNPAPGRRICSDCKDEKGVSEFLVKNATTGNRMPWCRSCGRLRGRRNYVSAAEAGIVTLARAHLAAGSPFIGQACPDCGLGLEAGQEVEGCDVTVRHVTCPPKAAGGAAAPPESQAGVIARCSPLAAAAAPPAAAEFVAPVIGWDPVTGEEVRWMDPGGPGVALSNGHSEVWGASGVGKTQFVMSLLAQLARSKTRFGVADFKNDYEPGSCEFAAATGAEFVDLWQDGLAYNPLALHDDSSRAIDSAVIEIRDAVAVAARAFTRMGHRQLDQLRTALKDVYQAERAEGRWPTMLDLDAGLSPDLTAVIGDLTRNRIFGEGPPLGEAIEQNLIFGLTGIPGNGITQALAAGFILSSLMLRIHALPPRPNTISYALVIDEAHRVAAFKAIDTLLREGRSKGLAVILATQQPGDMPTVVGANAATRVCFQLPDAVSAAAAAKRLDPGDATLPARIQGLDAGTAVVRLGQARPRVLKMPQFYRDRQRLEAPPGPRPAAAEPSHPQPAPPSTTTTAPPGRPRPAARRPASSTGAARRSGFVPTGLPVRDPAEDPEDWQDRRRRAAW